MTTDGPQGSATFGDFGATGPSSAPSYPSRGQGQSNALTPREPGALSVVLTRVQNIRKNLEAQTGAMATGLNSISGPSVRPTGALGQQLDGNAPPHLLGKLESELTYVEGLLADLARHTTALAGLV